MKRRETKPAIQDGLDDFWESVTREQFEEAIYSSSHAEDPKWQALMAAILNPEFAEIPISRICRKLKINMNQLLDVWRARTNVLAMLAASQHTPQILNDIAIDATSKDQACARCDGVGVLKEEDGARDCPTCIGKGIVRVPGDTASRKFHLEIQNLTRSGGGSHVNVPIQIVTSPFGGPEATVIEVEKILNKPRLIEEKK